jgi:hypothetical protein
MKKILFLLFSLKLFCSGQEIIFEDNFEKGKPDKWEIYGNVNISLSPDTWKDRFIQLDKGAKIISLDKIKLNDVTISFDIINFYSTPTKFKFFYIDENNYYYFEPVKGVVGRVINGEDKRISDGRIERILSIVRGNPAKSNYKIYFKNSGKEILIMIDKDGYLNGAEYEFKYYDRDDSSVKLFINDGKISITEDGSGNYNYWVWYDNIKVYSGIFNTKSPRKPDILYVDKKTENVSEKIFSSIQKAIDFSIPGDLIIVKEGEYDEKISFDPKKIYGTEEKPLIIKSEKKHKAKVNSFNLKFGDYVTIDGFEITGSTISTGGSKGVKIINNYIHDLKGQVGIVVDGENDYVAGNYILRCNKGIVVGGKNNLVENNEIERLIYVNQDADYFRVFGEGHIIRNNYMHGTKREEIGPSHTDGFQTFDNNGEYLRHTIIEGNFIEDFYAQGFMGEGGIYYHSYDITFRNNIFKDAGAWGLCISSIRDVKVYNNIFINLGIHGVGFTYRDKSKPSSGEVFNNIFYNGGNFYWAQEGCNIKAGNNILFSTKNYIDPSKFPNDIVNKDPLFMNIQKNDFHLHPSSPAIDKGKELTPSFPDRDGNERPTGKNWDIGPYEYKEIKSPVPYISYIDAYNNISTNGYEPYKIYFSGELSYVPSERKIVEFCWDFGDGSEKVYKSKCEHTFKNGKYNVILTIKDDKGETGKSDLMIEVFESKFPHNYLKIDFEENFNDISGKNMKVKWNGNPGFGEGIKGKAGYFDNKSSKSITVQHADYFDGIKEFTWSFWVKKNKPEQKVIILLKHTVYAIELLPDGFSVSYLSGEKSSTGLSYNKRKIDNNWHHYAITYDGEKLRLYFDGKKVEEKQFNERIRRDRSRDITIGQDPWGEGLDGFIDELNFYDVALNENQILQLYNLKEPF